MMHSPAIEQAFASRQDLKQQIYKAQTQSPKLTSLFESIAQHINTLQSPIPTKPLTSPHPSKKRKIETSSNDAKYISFRDLSFSIPQRKKLHLDLAPTSSSSAGIRIRNPTTNDIETTISWSSITEIACLPVPEKATAQYNFCIFTTPPKDPSNNVATGEQILFTVPSAPPKPSTIDGLPSPPQDDTTYKTLLLSHFNSGLKPYRLSVTEPSTTEFSSQMPQATRKGAAAYHIKAFRGAKEGYLFLLSTGIIWGFKKPLEFFPFECVESTSYTSVLQRTFNLNVTVRRGGEGAGGNGEGGEVEQEFEFSMIDQADFAGIDAYVKRHRLQDKSMAEQRRAKKLNVNGVGRTNNGQEGGDEDDADGEGELQKAAREAEAQGGRGVDEDEDSEEDENFDPGSEGESEGEGSESSGDDGEGGDGEEEGEDEEDEVE